MDIKNRIKNLVGREVRVKIKCDNSSIALQGIVSDITDNSCHIGHRKVYFRDMDARHIEEI
jgi:RNase P/RNase MRP subunit p29